MSSERVSRVWRPFLAIAAAGACVVAARPGSTQGANPLTELNQHVETVARLAGEPSLPSSMGVSGKDLPLRSLESREPLDSPKRRLVILGGLDGDDRGPRATLEAIRWFKTQAPAALREGWNLSAVACGNPEGLRQLKPTNDFFGKPAVNYPPEGGFFQDAKAVENRYLWRWLAFQAPDLVLIVNGASRTQWRVPPAYASLATGLNALPLVSPDTLAMSLSRGTPNGLGTVPALSVDSRGSDGPRLLEAALKAGANLPRSPMRQAVLRRMSRTPAEIANLLAPKYPQTPAVQYIPAVAWVSELRLAKLANAPQLADKVKEAVNPYLTGVKPLIDGKPDVAKLAGHIVFAELAELEGNEAAKKVALEAAAMYKPEKEGELPQYGRFWTDDMFMTATLLGRAARLGNDSSYYDLMARMLVQYAAKLQRPGGLFVHAPEAPHAWGRGNGFASLGLMEGLTYLPPTHPQRAAILAAFRKQMDALRKQQTPEGTFRQVIDHPESYREVTATAMNLAAMARGIRMGWLDASFRPVVQQAWRGLLPRIAEDGSLVDVCSGTGAGPTLRYYYERPATSGLDDRGGAMCLLAAVEMMELK